MEAQHDVVLTHGEVRWLLGSLGLAAARDSPLNIVPDAAPRQPRSPELQGGEWQAALATLAQPDRCVRTITPRADASKTAFYYGGSKATTGLVGFWPEDASVRISFPVTTESILDNARRNLKTDLPSLPDPFSATLSISGLWTLMAALDVLRAAQLAALLERHVGLSQRFELSHLQQQIEFGLAQHDARWSVTLLRLLAPAAAAADLNATTGGLSELALVGLLTLEGTSWTPRETLLRLLAGWAISLPAMAHETVTLGGDTGIAAHEHCIAVRGEGPLWIIDFLGLAQGKASVLFRSADGSAYIEQLHKMIGHLAATSPSPAASPVATAMLSDPRLRSGHSATPVEGVPQPTIAKIYEVLPAVFAIFGWAAVWVKLSGPDNDWGLTALFFGIAVLATVVVIWEAWQKRGAGGRS